MEMLRVQLRALAQSLEECHEDILALWRTAVESDSQLEHSAQWSRAKLQDHIPQALELFNRKLREWPYDVASGEVREEHRVANLHSKHRWQQGFRLRSVMREWGHLNSCVLDMLDDLQQQALTPNNAAAAENKEAETESAKSSDAGPGISVAMEVWGTARALWAALLNESLSESAVEYHCLIQTEAATRARELEATFNELREVERARGELLRSVAHDLRGSLSVVGGTAEMIDNVNLLPDDRAHVHNMLRRSVKSLHEMISNLMDISRLEAGQETLQIAEFDAAQLLRELCSTLQAMAIERNLELSCEGPENLPVQGDAVKVRRIAQNLLLNALKYTQQGSVHLLWQRNEGQGEGHWHLQVRDTGPGLHDGIAAPLTAKLEEATKAARSVDADVLPLIETSETPKSQPANTAQRSTASNGEGIGLSIVKRLCDLLNAILELETRQDVGTMFRVTFPTQYDN
ncbi:MAG: hypothetical protein JWN98_2709 [Abditibacteriota bacterium]|nr:hypothetical protein [Abditibacteriota bacterium]